MIDLMKNIYAVLVVNGGAFKDKVAWKHYMT